MKLSLADAFLASPSRAGSRHRCVYILLFDEIRDQWELIMFSAANAQRLATRAA